MTANGSGLPSAATKGEARKIDQLGGSITSEDTQSGNANQAQLISTIKAHIAKGDKAAENGHLAEELQAAKIRMAGLESEIEELRSAAPADGGNLVDQALKLVSRMSEAERKQFRDRLQQDFPPRRGRPPKEPQAETEPLITVAHDNGDDPASAEKMKATMTALDAGADCGPMPDFLRRTS